MKGNELNRFKKKKQKNVAEFLFLCFSSRQFIVFFYTVLLLQAEIERICMGKN